ncbi:RING finger family 4 domain-containing protein, partial [Actinocorallia lasiicapitis]
MLLRRRRTVVPGALFDGLVPPARQRRVLRHTRADVANGLIALETDLAGHGYLLGPELHRALGRLTGEQLAVAGRRLVGLVAAESGADVPHVPLFRRFPDSVPDDTLDLYVRRIFTLILQEPAQPCVLCGDRRSVQPVAPCAHLVCRACWDGGEYSACPLCHRRIDPDDPFLRPVRERGGRTPARTVRRTRVLGHHDDA